MVSPTRRRNRHRRPVIGRERLGAGRPAAGRARARSSYDTGARTIETPDDLAQATAMADLQPRKHYVEIMFVDPHGRPLGGLPYTWIRPSGSCDVGELGDDARLREDDADDGPYVAHLREVESVTWSVDTAAIGDEIEIEAETSGFPSGTKAKVLVFRELAESDDEALAEIEATVSQDRVVARWTCEVGSDVDRDGVVDLVAEVRVGGAAWAKTHATVQVQLPTIERADWSTPASGVAEEIRVEVETAGIPDGTEVTVDIMRSHHDGEGEHVASIDGLTVVGGGVVAPFRFDEAVPDAVGSNFECYFEVTIEYRGLHHAVSDLGWFHRGAAS